MKAYTTVQKKLLVNNISLWKKNEEFDKDYQNKEVKEKQTEEQEQALPSLASP